MAGVELNGGRRSIAVEEKKEGEHGSADVAGKNVPVLSVMDGRYLSTPMQNVQCELVLESMEECVGCLDGVGEQHIFEEGLTRQAAHQRQIAMEHGLSEAEAALIRLQMISNGAEGIRSAVEETLSKMPGSLDILHVCGRDDSVNDLCDGIVHPMDTTLPTSQPGNKLVESIQDKSARSLVDVAAEDDGQFEYAKTPFVDDNVQECAICSDSVEGSSSLSPKSRKPTFCYLPCCETKDRCFDECDEYVGQSGNATKGNFKVCTACMLVLTVATRDGTSRVGRCPCCRTWISILTLHSTSSSMMVRKLVSSGQCKSCMQEREPLIEEDPGICDGCFLGTRVPLMYECEECHQQQKINATLYRSQPTSSSFGNEMWPCTRCQKSTHWKLPYEQLSSIPAGDVPEEWGDDFLELARRRVQTARRGIAKLDLQGRNAKGVPMREGSCVIS